MHYYVTEYTLENYAKWSMFEACDHFIQITNNWKFKDFFRKNSPAYQKQTLISSRPENYEPYISTIKIFRCNTFLFPELYDTFIKKNFENVEETHQSQLERKHLLLSLRFSKENIDKCLKSFYTNYWKDNAFQAFYNDTVFKCATIENNNRTVSATKYLLLISEVECELASFVYQYSDELFAYMTLMNLNFMELNNV